MAELSPGLYEALITEGLKAQLAELAERLPSRQRELQAAEAPHRIAWHLSRQIELALAATYRGHVGERPMAVTWELQHPLPGDLYAAFAAAVA